MYLDESANIIADYIKDSRYKQAVLGVLAKHILLKKS